MKDFIRELKWRGVLYDHTEGLEELTGRVVGYIGFDPTARSLHVGSLLPLITLSRFQRFGNIPIAVIGGGTGLIGDPSGKTKERPLLSKEEIEENIEGIKAQIEKFLDFKAKENPAKIVNNYDWLGEIKLVDFLREVGKHITVNYMLQKESVRNRIQREEGISFTEFSYMLLQAYDFLMLYDRENCVLQMGGSDQWGNITAGIDLIRKMRGGRAYGLVFPLITTSSGVKFGKTEEGTVWLDPNLTSPFKFYQFWINTEDADVIRYLKYFTFLGEREIGELEESLKREPEKREPHRVLAREVTRMVHGEDAMRRAERASKVLFGEEIKDLNLREILEIFSDVPSKEIPKERFEGEGYPIVELLVDVGLFPSKGEARRAINGGGVYVNNIRVSDAQDKISLSRAIEGKVLILRKGKKNYLLVKLV
ncbi:MAG: tyrosine--tRNA ligase [Candidatus Caldipriscus sp.]|nr:tyrosine--tRNA ligase [Candidatus Caldipriscus sp.]